MMRVKDWVRKAIVFIGIVDDTGAFAPYGTAFLVGWPASNGNGMWQYLVTAKHVLNDMRASKRPLAARVNTNDGGAKVGRLDDEVAWHEHPDPRCDIAVTGFRCSPETFDHTLIVLTESVLTPEYIAENDIGCGDDVFTAGLLVSHFGRNRNVPIIRAGIIAAMPEEHVDLGGNLGEQEVYLVESRSIGGLSGSPVFLQSQMVRLVGDEFKMMGGHRLEYLMGVNIGLFETKAHGDKLPIETIDRREHFLEAMSAGVAVVVPIQRVIDIIASLQKERELVEKEKDTGFRATSAKSAELVESNFLTTDESPSHREDFGRLLQKASKPSNTK